LEDLYTADWSTPFLCREFATTGCVVFVWSVALVIYVWFSVMRVSEHGAQENVWIQETGGWGKLHQELYNLFSA
jgi:hypothetical protein